VLLVPRLNPHKRLAMQPMNQAAHAASDDGRAPGPIDKAAIVLMALDDERSHQIASRLSEAELRQIGRAMVTLGKTDASVVEQTIMEFGLALGQAGSMRGGPENAARLLRRVLPPAKAAQLLSDIAGSGSDLWEKLAQIQPANLAGYLAKESPQVVAVILTRLPASHAGVVFGALPAAMIGDVATRMVRLEGVNGPVLSDIEEALRRDLVGDTTRTSGPDSAALLAEVLNSAQRPTVDQILAALEAEDPQAALRVRGMMFTFEDLIRVDRGTFGMLVSECAAEKLPIALSSASTELRDLFLSSMSERAANMLREEIEALPAQRKRLVDDARSEIVALAKRLADEGRIFILDREEAAAAAAGDT